MSQYYEEEYHTNKHNYLIENPFYYFVRSEVALKLFFKGISKSSKVLEYGCGLGQNICFINNSVGFEISKYARDFCKIKGIKVISNLNKLKSDFDVVLCVEVLEHLNNPLEALKEMKSKLKEGGKLILVLPVDKWNKPNLNDVNKHLYNWNFNTITNLLNIAGFNPVHYEMIRATSFKRLLPIYYNWNSKFYMWLTKFAAIITGSKHMKIIAVKR